MVFKIKTKKIGIIFLIFLFSIIFAFSFDEVTKPSKNKPELKADLWPVVTITANTNETNTTATITAIANDYGSNAGLLWLKIYENNSLIAEENCNQQTTCTLVKIITHNEPGYYEYYAKTKDIGGHEKQSEKIYVLFHGFNQPPIITSYIPEDLTPEVEENSSLYFKVNAYDPNGDPLTYKFLLDGQVVSNTNEFLYQPGFFDAGLHEVLAIVADNKGGVATLKWNVTVINVLIPTECELSFNPESPIVYGTYFKAFCSCNNPEAQAEMYRDGINVTNEIGQSVLLAAKPSGYLYVCNVSETENYANASVEALYIINKASHTAHLALNSIEADIEVTYPTEVNASGWLEIDQAISNAVLLRNGSVVASGSPATEIVVLPAGVYNYTYYYPESQNYTEARITRFLTVKKNQTILSLNAIPGWQVVYGNPVNITCNANNNQVLLNLYRDNNLVASGYGLIYDYVDAYQLAAGDYEYVCNTSGNQNYTAASVSNILKINKAQTILSLDAIPGWQVVYGTQTIVSCYANHNQATLHLYRNNQEVENPDIALLAAGNYAYVCNMSESQNYTAATANNVLIVNKAQASVNLLLNGVDGDIDVNINEEVFAEGFLELEANTQPIPIPIHNKQNVKEEEKVKLVQGPFTIYLFVDGNVKANGDYYLNYTTSFNESQVGLHNFTLYFPGNQNYTEAYETHFVNVLADTQSPNVTIHSPLNQTYETNIIDLNYSVEDNIAVDSCWYTLNDQSYPLPDCQNTTLELENGFYHLVVYANDTSNNIGFDEVYFTVASDTEPPVVVIESPLNQTYTTNEILINISASDNIAIDRIWFRINYGENITYTEPLLIELEDGSYFLEAWANDTSNNIGYDYVYFTVNTTPDTEPPTIIFVSPTPENDSIININWVYVNASVTDNVAVDTCLLEWNGINESMQMEGSGNSVICYINKTELADGIYSFKVYANDTAGNIGESEERIITIDTTPPSLTFVPPTPENNSIVNVNFVYVNVTSSEALNNAILEWNGNNYTMEGAGDNWYINMTNLEDGLYSYKVYGNDTAGNIGESEERVVIVNTSIPNNPPEVNLISPENGSINNDGNVTVIYSVVDDTALTLVCDIYSNTSGSWQIDISQNVENGSINNYTYTNLDDGVYIWNVGCYDGINYAFAPENYTFIVNTTIPNNPPYVELIQPENGEIINSTSVDLTFYVFDDSAALLDCYLYTNISGEWQQTDYKQVSNDTIDNFTLDNLDNGVYLWNVECNDGVLSNFAPENWTFIIDVIHDVGIDDTYSSSINGIRIIDEENGQIIMDDPANLMYGKNYSVRARVMNYGPYPENVNIIIKIVNETDEFIIRDYNQTINVIHYASATFNTSDYDLGSYYVVINVTLLNYIDQNLSNNERNRSFNIIVDIPPYWQNENVTPPSPAVYGTGPYNFSIEWFDNNAVTQVVFEFDNNNYTPTCIPSLPSNETFCYYVFDDLPAGEYSYRWYAQDGALWNSTPTLIYIIEKAETLLNLNADPSWQITYGDTVNISCQANNNEVLLELYRNDTLVASGYELIYDYIEAYELAAGDYLYVCYASESQNYSSASASNTLTINKAETELTLVADPSWQVVYGTETNVSCQANNDEAWLELYRNDNLVAEGYSLIYDYALLDVGTYIYVCNTTGSQNYTAASVSEVLIVTEILPGEVHLWIDGIEGNVTKIYDGEGIIINASTPYGNVSIYRNGTLIAEGEGYAETFENLPAGVYNFTAYSTGDSNHTSASITYFLTIEKANSSLRLYLNGIEGDITIVEGQEVNHTAILETPEQGTLYLLRNGSVFASGNSPLTYISIYNTPGHYNITAFYAGNENYTSSSVSYLINVNPAIHDVGISNIWQVKANGRDNRSIYLYDELNVSVEVVNYGNVDEEVIVNFTDTYIVNGVPITVLIDTININLSAGQSEIVRFSYNSTPKGVHTLRIEAIIANDINSSNNFKTLDLVVWSVEDIVSQDTREIFVNNYNPPLNEIFYVYLPIQNNFVDIEFYDFPVLLTIEPNNLTPIDPVQQYKNLSAGQLIVVEWTVNATATGLYEIGAIEGNNELIIPSKTINVIG